MTLVVSVRMSRNDSLGSNFMAVVLCDVGVLLTVRNIWLPLRACLSRQLWRACSVHHNTAGTSTYWLRSKVLLPRCTGHLFNTACRSSAHPNLKLVTAQTA